MGREREERKRVSDMDGGREEEKESGTQEREGREGAHTFPRP